MNAKDTLFEFPCEFPIKVVGRASAEFDTLVVSIVRQHVPDLGEGSVSLRPSSGGKYLAVTVTFVATSREQLDALYEDLTGTDEVLWVL